MEADTTSIGNSIGSNNNYFRGGITGQLPITDHSSDNISKRESRWSKVNDGSTSRWKSVYEKEYIPPAYSDFPPGMNNYEIDQFLREQRLEELIYKLQMGEIEYGSPDIREPSPPPIYDKNGSRINTREARVRKNMEEELSNLIEYMSKNVEGYVVPKDYKPLKKTKKLIIPLDKYPDYNFMGLIIGPRGYNHRRLEAESGTQISIRGKGTTKEGKKCDHQTEEELAMPMHIHITAESQYKLDKAVSMIQPLLDPFHPLHEEYKRDGLQQLAIINGTLNTNLNNSSSLINTFSSGNNAITLAKGCLHCGSTQHPTYACPDVNSLNSFKRPDIKCSICGDKGHITKDCKQYVPNNNVEEEFKKMMIELGHEMNYNMEGTNSANEHSISEYNVNGDYYENLYSNNDGQIYDQNSYEQKNYDYQTEMNNTFDSTNFAYQTYQNSFYGNNINKDNNINNQFNSHYNNDDDDDNMDESD
ncbi:transcription or splicing factor [Cryptosporidium sp. chipmunk genotype I]|uniref:transcription or splicing factor n=1 Tax=Cryptosporidium sp. chipmunk genotype I TaxID=1280935 RepID=UPI00351A3B3C|nr:transcription or splicing factor [Cryptosporidium sp. chipmunk genotype I]